MTRDENRDHRHVTATKRKPKPITAHPLFPAVTALWFATFFGLGSFAVAPALLEGPVVALGIPALIPAAAPPLGFTARVMLALAMLVTGGAIGFLVGRRLGPQAATVTPRKRAAAGFARRSSAAVEAEAPRRPLNPAEDLDESLFDASVDDPAPLRRRSLSLSDEGQLHMPSELAPLPGTCLPWEQATRVAPEPAPHGTTDDPLALDTLLENAQARIEDAIAAPTPSAPAPSAPALDPCLPEPASGPVAQADPVLVDTAPAAAPAKPAPLLQAPVADITPLERAPLDNLGLVQMIERLALAISRRTAPRRDVSALEESSFAQPARETASAYVPVPVEAVVIASQSQLQTERVVRLHPAVAPQAAPEALAGAVDPITGLGSIADADADDDTDVPGLDRFLRVTKASMPAAADVAAAEPEVAEDRYPSLLDMGPAPQRHEALRINDGLGLAELPQSDGEVEPVVVFPGQDSPLLGAARPFERPSILAVPGSPLAAPGRAAPSTPSEQLAEAATAGAGLAQTNPEEADRALRAALATLQRMTAQG